MFPDFYPQLYAPSVYDIPYEFLYSKGFQCIFFDIDNTLSPFYIPNPPASIAKLIDYVVSLGFVVTLISNNYDNRVTTFAQNLPVLSIARAGKPKTAKIKKALQEMNMSPTHSIFVGDQLFTDILCANLLRMYPILVKPLSSRDEWTVKPKRPLERIFVEKYIKRTMAISHESFKKAPISLGDRKDNQYE